MTSIYYSTAILGATERPRLLHDFLLVEREDSTTYGSGILYTPEIVSPNEIWVGTIVGMGDGPKTKKGVRLPNDDIALGDRVAFNAVASWTSLVIGGKKYTMVRKVDLLGIIPPGVAFEGGSVRADGSTKVMADAGERA
jgi:co-chaperonin GroES (HSP10)